VAHSPDTIVFQERMMYSYFEAEKSKVNMDKILRWICDVERPFLDHEYAARNNDAKGSESPRLSFERSGNDVSTDSGNAIHKQ